MIFRGKSDLGRFCACVDYMTRNAHSAPFNLSEMAAELQMPLEEVRDHFGVIGRVFALRELLLGASPPPVTTSPGKTQQVRIEVTEGQMKIFSDFAYLARRKPIRGNSFSPALYDLLEDHPQLFEEMPGGWKAAPAGVYFAEQYVSFRKLKMAPGEMAFEQLCLAMY